MSHGEVDLNHCALKDFAIFSGLYESTVHVKCLKIVHSVGVDHGLECILCGIIISRPFGNGKLLRQWICRRDRLEH